MEALKSLVQGGSTEYEVAIISSIVAMDIMQANRELGDDANIVILPAPPQFEHGPEQEPNPNVDFVMLNITDMQAIGLQSKGKASAANVAKYDPDRVVIINGDQMLGNRKILEVAEGKIKQVPWAGIFAASLLMNNTRGRARIGGHPHEPFDLAMAKEITSHIPVEVRRWLPLWAAQNVASLVVPHLGFDTAVHKYGDKIPKQALNALRNLDRMPKAPEKVDHQPALLSWVNPRPLPGKQNRNPAEELKIRH